MNLRVTAKWVALALVGLAIAIGLAVAAADLTSQQIGIASESVSAGDALAPSLRTPDEREEDKHGGHERPAPGEETPSNSPPEPHSDDYGGDGDD